MAEQSFEQWFGGSKVVDDQGMPLVVYHGTLASEPIDRFQGLESVGWFAESPKLAERYASTYVDFSGSIYAEEDAALYPVYLSIQRPLRLDFDMNDPADVALAVAKELGVGLAGGYEAHEVINDSRIMAAALKAGYDGIQVQEDGVWTWAPLSSDQIRHASEVDREHQASRERVRA